MKHRTLLSLALLTFFSLSAAHSADIWVEDFTGQEGRGMYGSSSLDIVTNMGDITKWHTFGAGDLDGDATLNWWMVTNGVFEGQDVGRSAGYWQSESIGIDSNDNVQIKMDFAKVGGGCTASEYFKVNYSLDGGAFVTLLSIDQSNQDAHDGTTWTSTIIDSSAATGIVVEGKIKINRANDGWSFDNVVLQTGAAEQPPVLTPIGSKVAGSGRTLTFDVTATDPIDSDIIALYASNLPPGAVFTKVTHAAAVTNTFTWTSVDPVGVYTTVFYAADNHGIDSEVVEILIAGFAVGHGKVWLNELHYDNPGTDTNEGFEIAGPAGTDLSDTAVYRYNGSGAVQGSIRLSGTVDEEANQHGAVWFNWSGLQNTGPHALALINLANGKTNLNQFVSYGGEFVAAEGPANGIHSIDIGVLEDGADAIDNSLQLTGSGQIYPDFTWSGPTNHSRGFLNTGQIIKLPGMLMIVR